MNKQEVLLERYYKTSKGCKIIAASMKLPIKLCRPVYKDGKVYHRIDGKLLDEQEVAIWEQEQQHLHRKQAMEKWGLTEADMIISEENIKQIEQEEKRNIGIFGEDKEDLRQSIVDLSTPKIRAC